MPIREELRASQLRESQLRASYELFSERLAELECQIEDAGWRRLCEQYNLEFSREGLDAIIHTSRLMFLKNPLLKRAFTLQALYVWGQGCEITCEDEAVQKAIDRFLDDPKNRAELTSHEARVRKEQDIQVSGNLFFVLFGGQTNSVVVRTIPVQEIRDIICNPEDRCEPWFYKRIWQQPRLNEATGEVTTQEETAYYPALGLDPAGKPQTIGGKLVLWDSPVIHRRRGCLSDMRFGVPEYYAAFDWAKAYNAMLSDFATIIRSLARFSWQGDTKGGQQSVNALQARLNNGIGTGNQTDSNPPPIPGGALIGSGVSLTPIRTAGATTSATEGIPLRLMVASAVGMGDPMLSGDVSTGNLATAKTLDRPTELQFLNAQAEWRDTYVEILQYAVAGASNGLRYIDAEKPVIKVTFPPILEHDVKESVDAVVAAAGTGELDHDTITRELCTALGIKDVDAVLDAVAEERAENEAKAAEIAAQGQPQQRPNPQQAAVEAIRMLREVLKAKAA